METESSTAPKPVNNIEVLRKRKPDPTGPMHDNEGNRIDNAYQQNHTYLTDPDKWYDLHANLIRRYDKPPKEDPDNPRFLGTKECGICTKTADGWCVYPGLAIFIYSKKDPDYIDYPTVDALLDDGWEVD